MEKREHNEERMKTTLHWEGNKGRMERVQIVIKGCVATGEGVTQVRRK